MNYFWAFCVGGAICVAGQLLIDLTSITPARVLVIYVVAGVVLSALGLYDPLAEFAGAGASVPLLGFGHLLAQGVRQAVDACGLHIEVQSFNERRVEWALVSRLPEEETPEEQEK